MWLLTVVFMYVYFCVTFHVNTNQNLIQQPWGEITELQGERRYINKILTNGLKLRPPTFDSKRGTLQLSCFKLWLKDILPISETSSWWVLQISGETMPFLYMIWLKVNIFYVSKTSSNVCSNNHYSISSN